MNRAARRRLLWILALALVAIAATVILLLPAPGQGIATGPAEPRYVGSSSCEECHAEEAERWRGSHHELAMQEAGAQTPLGSFAGARFYRKNGGLFVRTEGPDGRPGDYRLAYSIGVSPLQQYLLAFPGDRFQILGVARDTRPEARGGQRWLHVSSAGRGARSSAPRWMKGSESWNARCAECHATNVRKGYRWPDDRFATSFSAIGVSCEACHGAGSRHVAWAEEARSRGRPPRGDPGLVVRFDERRGRTWEMDPTRGIAKPSRSPAARLEVEACGRCHARREPLTEEYAPGRLLTETHRPALLDEALYLADGQVRGEAYEWGSYLQSRMYAAGVTCSDCHDAHDAKVRGDGDAVCLSCHQPERFATRRHHFHRESGRGASCVSCHMRSRTSRVVDGRHDHSLRVPRPDLTVTLGSSNAPNACNDCHRDRSARWAAQAVRRWYPHGRSGTPHYGETLLAGRSRAPRAAQALVTLARDAEQPAIVRATAVSLLPAQTSRVSLAALQKAAADPEPLVRLAAASALPALAPADRLRAGVSLLWDPVRAVRVEAVPAFADVPDSDFESEQRAAFDHALDDYFVAQRTKLERPESQVNLGIVHAKRRRFDEARRAYETALGIAPQFLPAHLQLAELLRVLRRDEEAEGVLRRALEIDGASASLHHALGLLLARRGRPGEALAELGRAFALAPADPRVAEAYASRLRSAGRQNEAFDVLRSAQRLSPGARELLVPLIVWNRDRGSLREAKLWARRLLHAAPEDPQALVLAGALGVADEVASR